MQTIIRRSHKKDRSTWIELLNTEGVNRWGGPPLSTKCPGKARTSAEKPTPKAYAKYHDFGDGQPSKPAMRKHIFLSYFREDFAAVTKLHDALLTAGENVWWDQDIQAGQQWRIEISKAIRNAYAVLVCLSEATAARSTAGVYPELRDAIAAYREYPPGSVFLIPVRLSDCEIPVVPIDATTRLDDLQYIDLWPSSAWQDGITKLLYAISKAPTRLSEETGPTPSVVILPAQEALGPAQPAIPSIGHQFKSKVLSVGHIGAVKSIAFNPNGQRIVSGDTRGTVVMWDTANGEILTALENGDAPVLGLDWTSDGQYILSTGKSSLLVWNAVTGELVRELKCTFQDVRGVAASHDSRLALIIDGSRIRILDLATGICVREFEGHGYGVNTVAWSPDGQRILSGGDDRRARVWSVEDGQCLLTLECDSWVWSVAWSPDGRKVISGDGGSTVRIWDAVNGNCLHKLSGHSYQVYSVTWSPGIEPISGDGAGKMRFWNSETGQCIRTIKIGDCISALAWSRDNRYVVSGDTDACARLWHSKTGRCLQLLKGYSGEVDFAAWSPGRDRILSCVRNEGIRTAIHVSETSGGRAVCIMKGGISKTCSLLWSHDGRHVFSGAENGKIYVWVTETGDKTNVLTGHIGKVQTLASASANGGRLLSGGADGALRIWEPNTARCVAVLEGHFAPIIAADFYADGKRAVSAGLDNTVRLWDIEAGRCIGVLEDSPDGISALACSPDGRVLLGTEKNAVQLWDLTTRRCIRVLRSIYYYGAILDLTWSPDGLRVAACTQWSVQAWEIESGQSIVSGASQRSFLKIAWSIDGNSLISCNRHGVIRTWPLR